MSYSDVDMATEQEPVHQLLSGQGLAAKIRVELKQKISHSRVQPGLAVILVGHDPASKMYVQFKSEASEEVGMYLETIELPEEVPQKKLMHIIRRLNKNKKIHGILVQLPLPKHIDPLLVLDSIDPRKDVDGFHPENVGWHIIGRPYLMPATTRGIARLVEAHHIPVHGKHVVVVGKSNIVGKPTAMWFMNQQATVTICHKYTVDLSQYTKQADILVTATGVPRLITADMVKKGVVVIDAGITKLKGEVVGDVDFEAVSKKASAITPVPGGVGPMTVASLLENTWIAMRRIHGYDDDLPTPGVHPTT